MNPMASSFVNKPMDYWGYRGLKVKKSDWISFIKDIGFKEYAKKCVSEDPSTGASQESRFMAKLTQLKTSKRGLVVYEDGA